MAKKTHFPPFCKFEPRQLRKKHGDPPLSLQVLMCHGPRYTNPTSQCAPLGQFLVQWSTLAGRICHPHPCLAACPCLVHTIFEEICIYVEENEGDHIWSRTGVCQNAAL